MVDPAGLLLAFEGIDGCGKSTQAARAVEWLRRTHPDRRTTLLREPGGTPLGEQVRALLLEGEAMGATAEMLLYMAARAELYERIVLPALSTGDVIVLDRSHYSTAAYQGAGLEMDPEPIERLTELVTRGRLPDRVLLFDLPPELAAARLSEREETPSADRIERRDASYFERVAEAYRALARADPGRFVILDARGGPEQIESAVRQVLVDVL
jgi:dTMP kinase